MCLHAEHHHKLEINYQVLKHAYVKFNVSMCGKGVEQPVELILIIFFEKEPWIISNEFLFY